MGWLGNFAANGCRKAMRMSYERGLAEARRRHDDQPHQFALATALASRYATRRSQMPDQVVLWADLAPFLYLDDENRAIAALAEYAVYQEDIKLADVALLRAEVNAALRKVDPADDNAAALLHAGMVNRVGWLFLLDSDTHERVRNLAAAAC